MIEANNICRKRERDRGGIRGADYDYYIYSGRECFDIAFEVFRDYIRLACVAWHEK